MSQNYDVLIIGAGVVGCCLASDLARSGYSVVVVEKANDVATGASKANSGLVHAGYDPKPNTLKARLNLEGNKMYPSLCQRLGVKLKKTGAIVVGNDKGAVDALYERGKQNGLKNLEVLGRDGLLKLCPNLNSDITIGLYAKDAYIVSPYLLTICLAEEAILNGATFLLNDKVKNCKKQGKNFEITAKNTTFTAKYIVNSAGAGYNEVAKVLGSERYKIEFRRGEYYVLDSTESGLTPITVFPLPSAAGKGVLVTPTIDGNILVGPTSYQSDVSTKTTKEGLDDVKQKSSALIEVNLRKAIRQFAGIRAITEGDFTIEKSRKVEGVINLAGICSPGLSSAPAISKYVFSLLGLEYNPSISAKKIKPYFLLKDLNDDQINSLIVKNKSYGRIICKCENITEGDILFALNRPLRVNSIDGVKRRVRAGMGRCQGGFCKLPVAEIIAKHNKISLDDVLKENEGSKLFVSPIRGGKND